MFAGFRRSRKGIVAVLRERERLVLAGLIRQTAELLEGGPGSPEAHRPGDREAGPGRQDADDDSFEAIMRRAGFSDDDATVSDAAEADATIRPSADPAVRRLLPDGHHDDPDLAADFRRMTGAAVRDRKLGHLRRAARTVEDATDGRLVLDDEEALSLLIAMTDVRLVLAERLGLDSDEAAESLSERIAELDEDDPRFALALGYEFLTWLQETLAVAMHP